MECEINEWMNEWMNSANGPLVWYHLECARPNSRWNDNSKGILYKDSEQVFDHFPKDQMKILLF